MFAVKNSHGDFFQGYDCGIMFWGDTDYLTFSTEFEASKVVECINSAPYCKNPHPEARVESI